MHGTPELSHYPSDIEIALHWILRAEGFLSDDPDDRGGITKYGISLRYLKSLGKDGDIDGDGDVDRDDIRALSLDRALELFVTGFWYPARCGELPRPLGLAVFDGAVNMGRKPAAKILQQTLKVRMDGVIGPVTLKAAQAAFSRYPDDVLVEYLGFRSQHYHDITLAESTYAKFLQGWINRLFRLQLYIERSK